MNPALYLLLLLAGILCLVGGLFVTRRNWRADAEPFGRHSPFFRIALHPGRFARTEYLGVIRALNLAGALLILGALLVAGYDILSSMAGR